MLERTSLCIVIVATLLGLVVGALFGIQTLRRWDDTRMFKTIAIVAPSYTDATPSHAAFVKGLYEMAKKDGIECVMVHFEMANRTESPYDRQRKIFMRLLESASSCNQDIVIVIIKSTHVLSGVKQLLIKAMKEVPNDWRCVMVGKSSIAVRPPHAKALLDMLDRLPTVFSDFEWLRFLKSPQDHELKEYLFQEDDRDDKMFEEAWRKSLLVTKPLQLSGHIPWVMFRTGPWPRASLPPVVKIYLMAFEKLNPRVNQIYLDDADAESFMQEHYPEHMKNYKSLVPGAYRADVLRLCLLLTHGGFYNDIGHLHKRPLGEICSSLADLYLVAEPYPVTCGVYNAFMGASRNDPLVRRFLQRVISNIEHQTYGETCLDITGPHVLGKVLHGMLGLTCQTPTPSGLQIMSDHRAVYLLRNHYNPVVVRHVIVHDENPANILIETKFPDYPSVTYTSRNTKHYSELWNRRQVYARK
jgi:mannosyltransferase OCH1-like enzyme